MIENAPPVPSLSDIAVKAAEYSFASTVVRITLTVILAALFSFGWAAGSTWYSIVFLILWSGAHLRWMFDSFVLGLRTGAHAKTEPK